MASSDSDSELCTSSDEKDEPRSLRKIFKGYKALTVLSIVAECWFVWSVGHWKDYYRQKSDHSLPGQGKAFVGEYLWTLIALLSLCILARCWVALSWRRGRRKSWNNKYGSLFMLFSTIQWVYYIGVYYRMQCQFTGIKWTSEVQVSAVSEGHWVDSAMGECLATTSTLECQTRLEERVFCHEEYDHESCSGYSWVGSGLNVTKCCVRKKFSLARPAVKVCFGRITVEAMFSLLQWVAVLAVKWALECSPFFDVSPTATFVKGCTLDILDSVVFARYLLDDRVLYPKFGISLASKGHAIVEDGEPYWVLFATWAVGMTLATLSPVLYIYCRPKQAEEEDAKNFEKTVTKLVDNLRQLQAKEAHALVDEAVGLQAKEYADQLEESAEGLCVRVDPDDEKTKLARELGELGELARQDMREGKATAVGGARYYVKYNDGEDPQAELLAVDHLEPDFEKHDGTLTSNFCSGWCSREQILYADEKADRFQARAEVLDALRSLFTLELPYFLWRCYMEWHGLGIDSFVLIIMSKNMVWGFMDLMIILSCANRKATLFGSAIVSHLDKFVSGSAVGTVWVGPAGIFRMATDTMMYSVKTGLEQEKAALNMKRAWLLVERMKVDKDRDQDDSWKLYTKAIENTDSELKVLDNKTSRAHY
eukprot:TRINITY_DN6082_c0_g2_i1.p1 TRINITY_DN6082_c0_g2~~TRINITY_DN6082_c0_g2_i1.p1  ORF type:complete len:651 (+),score=103.27 TRINITY_DN6082_c0_g2_i1:59-2011(+)